MDLVLYHHNHTKSNYPDLCSILKKADHHSASEREDIDDTQEVNKTPLISLFSKIVLEGNDKVDEQYIPLNKLSLDDGSFNNLKPAAKKDTMGGWNLVPEYNRLWDEFNSEFELIQNKTDFNTLLALLKKYASTMPSAAYKSKSDISLYDHSKTTAALAVSRYLFNRDGDVKLTQKDDLNCYLAIEGDISGIQKFIFKISSPQEAQSGMSKRLRGRSLYLTLLCDAIATYIAEKLELCEANILFCGGGRFTIIGPNTKMAKEKLAEIKSKLNKFFIDEFNAELYLALVSIECCGDDLAITNERKIQESMINLDNDPDIEFKKFLTQHSFPFSLKIQDFQIHEKTINNINRIIEKDIPSLKTFNTSTNDTISRIVTYIAMQKPGGTSNVKLAQMLGVSPNTINNILNVLEKTQLLFPITAYGTGSKIIKKPWEYFFLAPSIKASINFEIGRYNLNNKKCLATLAETLVASLLYKLKLLRHNFIGLFYDPKKSGVDFLVRNIDKIIPIEVGVGKKTKSQLTKAINNYNSDYGILISNRTFSIKKENNIIYIPLRTFSYI